MSTTNDTPTMIEARPAFRNTKGKIALWAVNADGRRIGSVRRDGSRYRGQTVTGEDFDEKFRTLSEAWQDVAFRVLGIRPGPNGWRVVA